MKDGLLLLDKEPGFTSHDVVQKVRRILKQKKIGHCGTLDPDATGLLLLTLGTATRLTRFLIRAPKVYEGVVQFGVATDTYDASGRTISEAPAEAVAALTSEAVTAAMRGFEGEIQQQPPPYSAKKVQGVKFYELARRGEEVPDEPKEVTVYEFAPPGGFEDGAPALPPLLLLGDLRPRPRPRPRRRAGGRGAPRRLRRTRIGAFRSEDALPLPRLEELVQAGEPAGPAWIPFDQIPLPFGEVTADPQQEHRIHHGQTVLVRELAGEEGDWVKLINRRREFIAVGTVVERIGTAGRGHRPAPGGVPVRRPGIVLQYRARKM